MYLSKVTLSRRFYDDPKLSHAFVYSAFPSGTHIPRISQESSAPLYRLESGGILLVQSKVEPNWAKADPDLIEHVAVKQFAPVFREGSVYHFMLAANPVKRLPLDKDEPGRGKIIALYRNDDRMGWLQRKGTQHGFTPVTANVCRVKRYGEGFRVFALHLVTFTGTLRVDNAELFAQAVTGGIGRGRAFGAGLLSVARA